MSVKPEPDVLHYPVQAQKAAFQSLYLHFILSIKDAIQSYTQPHLVPF